MTDGQTDGQNYDSQDRASIVALRGKNRPLAMKVARALAFGIVPNLGVYCLLLGNKGAWSQLSLAVLLEPEMFLPAKFHQNRPSRSPPSQVEVLRTNR